jgi:hypothetical protein
LDSLWHVLKPLYLALGKLSNCIYVVRERQSFSSAFDSLDRLAVVRQLYVLTFLVFWFFLGIFSVHRVVIYEEDLILGEYEQSM